MGFWVDLGDALADRGRGRPAGVRSGERYRILPLTWVQLATRPGEGLRLRAEHHHDDSTALIVPEPSGHLKHRPDGETRRTPLSRLVANPGAGHVEAGPRPDGARFLSPTGEALDRTNFDEDFLPRPLGTSAAPTGSGASTRRWLPPTST